MMNTPEQARELWCPMVRIARRETIEHRTGYQETYRDEEVAVAGCNTDALGGNRVPASCRCIADQCAMWRWIPRIFDTDVGDPLQLPPTHGYCGLAGRPEVLS